MVSDSVSLKQFLFCIILLAFFAMFFLSCSDSSLGNIAKDSADNLTEGGDSNNNSGSGGEANDNTSDNDSTSGKFDDQLKEDDVKTDFSNPLNFIGRYSILRITIKSYDGTPIVQENYSETGFKGNFGVDVDLKELSALKVKINSALKYQFHPTVVEDKNIMLALEFASKMLESKVANLADYEGELPEKITAIFASLGAKVVDNGMIEFTLGHSDIEGLATNEMLVVLLQKVGNNPRLALIADGNRYWNSNGEETDKPELPSDNVTDNGTDNGTIDNPGDIVIPDEPSDNVTLIDFNDLKTLTGHYEIIYFESVANAPVLGKQVVASNDLSRVQRMQGELSINSTAFNAGIISKMQMDSSYLDSMGQGNEKYAYSIYPEFGIAGSVLLNNAGDNLQPYQETKDVIMITQSFSKTVMGMVVPVNVKVLAKKISDTPKDISNKPYWGEGSGEDEPELPTIIPLDFIGNPSSIEGNYKVSKVCYQYDPKDSGVKEHYVCTDTPASIEKDVADISFKYDGGSSNNSFLTYKLQRKYNPIYAVEWVAYKKDNQWYFLYDNMIKKYTVEQKSEPNTLVVTLKKSMKYYKLFSSFNADVTVTITATKISDDYKEINGDKFF